MDLKKLIKNQLHTFTRKCIRYSHVLLGSEVIIHVFVYKNERKFHSLFTKDNLIERTKYYNNFKVIMQENDEHESWKNRKRYHIQWIISVHKVTMIKLLQTPSFKA